MTSSEGTMTDDDVAYFRQRVIEEQKDAMAAAGTDAELIHRDLVDRYERLVRKWEERVHGDSAELMPAGLNESRANPG